MRFDRGHILDDQDG